MLKRRIIPVQLLVNGRLVKPTRFDTWRDVGDPVKSSKVYNDQTADELVFLNIERGGRTIEPLLTLIQGVSEVCFMPLSVGGGVRTFEDAKRLILGGADKVVLNEACYRSPAVVKAISDAFGAQAVIASVDVRGADGKWACFSDCGRAEEPVTLDAHLAGLEAMGVGEVMITSIDREGTMTGYDVALLNHVTTRTALPVIGHGGCGTYEHMKEAFLGTRADALACASLFNFGDNNPLRAKAHLANSGIAFKVV